MITQGIADNYILESEQLEKRKGKIIHCQESDFTWSLENIQ